MSTIKVNKIENTATTDGGIEIDNTGHVQIDGLQLPTAGPLSNRNLIINGAMQVAQRGTVTGITTSKYGGPDRFQLRCGSAGTYSLEQSTDSPSGFSNSLKVSCTTVDADLTDGATNLVQHIEGQNLQHLKWGTANAEKLTLSFYAKASAAEDITVNLRDMDNGTLIGSTISLTTSWTKYTITFAAQTTGSGMDNDNGDSLWVEWWLGQGSDGTYTSGSVNSTWTAHAAGDRGAGNTFVIGDSTSNEFYLSGVQLEVGDKATPFEHRSFDAELQACQRYFQKSYPYSESIGSTQYAGGYIWRSNTATTVSAYLPVQFRSELRATPDINVYSVDGTINRVSAGTGSGGTLQNWVAGTSSYGATAMMIYLNGSPSTAYYNVYFHYTLEAEL